MSFKSGRVSSQKLKHQITFSNDSGREDFQKKKTNVDSCLFYLFKFVLKKKKYFSRNNI